MYGTISGAYRKVLWFAGLGAAGCAAAALIGEFWLWLTRVAIPVKTVSICLLLDSSGSMSGSKLAEMKQAAGEFVQRQSQSHHQLTVVGFDDVARVAAPLTGQSSSVLAAVNGLQLGGGTNMADGLRTAAGALGAPADHKYILLFTDGLPNSAPDTLSEAAACLAQQIQVVAVATGDADASFLGQVTRNPSLVFPAAAGQFEHAFQQAEKAIERGQLVESAPSGAGVMWGVVRIGVWTLLLAVGVGLALIAGQNIYLHRPWLSRAEGVRGGLGSAAAGFLAGAVGQALFTGTTDAPTALVILVRIVCWALVGLLIGVGIARFVPNIKPVRGLIGGAVGGAIGAFGFLVIGFFVGDLPARFLGAAIIGFCIGAMIALAETAFREAWLEVQYGPGEVRTVSLGRRPVAIGGDAAQATVFVRGAPAVALRYVFEGGQVYCDDIVAEKRDAIGPGDKRNVGKVTVLLRTASPIQASPSGTACVPSAGFRMQERPGAAPTTLSASISPSAGNSQDQPICLRIRGKQFPLTLGVRLRATDVPGLETSAADRVVAEVVTNPKDPTVLGLKNLSNREWETITADGHRNHVPTGRTSRIALGTKLRFGATEGILEAPTI